VYYSSGSILLLETLHERADTNSLSVEASPDLHAPLTNLRKPQITRSAFGWG
jgi:hypothetical protein